MITDYRILIINKLCKCLRLAYSSHSVSLKLSLRQWKVWLSASKFGVDIAPRDGGNLWFYSQVGWGWSGRLTTFTGDDKTIRLRIQEVDISFLSRLPQSILRWGAELSHSGYIQNRATSPSYLKEQVEVFCASSGMLPGHLKGNM